MHILIIGGTAFLGRALVETGLERGHTFTLFHRGSTNPGLFAGVEEILGDRERDLHLLAGRTFEAVIDTCGYFPRQVRASAGELKGRAGRYAFISSISVYADTRHKGMDESAPVAIIPPAIDPESLNDIDPYYGALKALCEAEAQAAFGEAALIIRPGLIVGPHDRSDRFTYWPWRIAQGGEVLAPGEPERAVQLIDVRDLAEWTLRLLEAGETGVFNATGQPESLPLGALFDACRAAAASEAHFTWASDDFLSAHEVGPWIELPLWIPLSDPDAAGFYAVSVEKAIASGLTLRPIEDTVRATLAFAQSRPADHKWRAGLERGKEEALLRELHG